jgi:hypothetical protein
VHVSRDGGKSWTKASIPDMPEWTMINSVDFDPHTKGGIYLAGTRYKLGDNKPYLYMSKDYGKTWTKITDGIDAGHFTRVLRVDPKRKGLLYAGTEQGMYISFDDGSSWKPFQLNLPIVPITDLTIKNDNLIAATQGRSFWLIDDLTPLHQLSDAVAKSDVHLYKPMPSYRMPGGQGGFRGQSKTEGKNHPGGVMIHYYVKDTAKAVASLEILEANGTLIKKYASKPDKKAKEEQFPKMKPGMNRFVWNMRYPNAEGFDGLILWGGGLAGPKAMPGTYRARLTVNGKASETEFEIVKDPRTVGTLEDIKEQFSFLISVRDKLSETNLAVKKIRTAREQINRVTEPMKGKEEMKEVNDLAKQMLDDMKKIEEALYQTKNRSNQDPLNYPVRLNDKLAALSGEADGSDYKPTQQVKTVYGEISGKIDEQLRALDVLFKTQVPKFNDLVKQKQVSAIPLETL